MSKEVTDMATDDGSDSIVVGCNSYSRNKDDDDSKEQSENTNSISIFVLPENFESGGCHEDEHSNKEEEILCIKTSSLVVLSSDKQTNDESNGQSNHQRLVHGKTSSKSSKSGSMCQQRTVPQRTTEKHTMGVRPSRSSVVAKIGIRPASADNAQQSNWLKKTKANCPLTSKEAPPIDHVKHHDGDACSDCSPTSTSSRTEKFKKTVPSAPTFRCSERAEKRREFYSKLEEKHQALEAERSQNEARTKEEREAALKQLRKSLMFKANPIPSFYQEGPPPKADLKKLPLTRARSPKFSRRKSCSDVTAAVPSDKSSAYAGRRGRHSLGSCKEVKVKTGVKNVNAASKDEKCTAPAMQSPEAAPIEVVVDANGGSTVE